MHRKETLDCYLLAWTQILKIGAVGDGSLWGKIHDGGDVDEGRYSRRDCL